MTFLAFPRVIEYGERPRPSTTETVIKSALQPAIRSLYAAQVAIDWSKGEPTNNHLTNAVNLVGYQLSHPDIQGGQTVANVIAGAVGTYT
jgi:hypothetical protein